MNSHYQVDRMWSRELLNDAQRFVDRMQQCLSRTEVAPTIDVVKSMVQCLSDNLDTPKIFGALERWCEQTESGATGGSPGELSRALDTYLGLAF